MSKTTHDLNRRDFIKDAAKVAAGVTVGLAATKAARADLYKSILPQTVIGANEKIRTGHIAVGNMGSANLRYALQCEEIQPIAVCDLWPPFRGRAVEMVESAGRPKPSVHVYFEEVIANKDVDAVVVSTPDHWHAIPSIMACEAGKDVWCEKPLATTIREGRAMVEAARRNNTVFQAGTMQRSSEHFQEAVELVRAGGIGKVARAAIWINENTPIEGLGNPPDEDPPPGLDWERYIGWTPKVPFNKNRFLYNFRWFIEYSSGNITDWGVHLVDIVLWAMGEEKKPRKISASGGKYVITDNRTTPDQIDALWEFDDYVLALSNCCYNDLSPYHRGRQGIAFIGALGTLVLDRGGYEVIPNKANGGCEPKKRGGSPMNEPHWKNFVQCIRERKRPISDVQICHNSTTVCHLGACAYVAGGDLEWDAEEERFFGRDRRAVNAGNKFANRKYENGWSLKPPYHKSWKM